MQYPPHSVKRNPKTHYRSLQHCGQMTTRLTYLITGLHYGGAEIGMARLLNALDADEFDVTIVGIADTGDDVRDLLPDHATVRVLTIRQRPLRAVYDLWRILRQTDVLVNSLFFPSVLGAVLGTLELVPCILTWQHSTTYQSIPRKYLYQVIYALSDQLLADSQAVADRLASFGHSESKINVLPLAGINFDDFQTRSSPAEESDTPLQVGCVGRVNHRKGTYKIVEMAQRLGPSYEFHVVGDGPALEDLKALAAERAPDNVTFHGERPPDEIPDILADWDVYVQPSNEEGLCITVIEAMASGLPVVASNIGGIPESITHESTGYLVPRTQIDEFCTYVSRLRENPDLRARIGENAREYIEEKYAAEALGGAFLTALRKC